MTVPASDTSTGVDAVFISWIKFHGRSEGLASVLGIDCVFVDGGAGSAPVRWFRQWKQTREILRTRKPRTIVLMQPPVPALWAVSPYVRRERVTLIGDLHTGFFTNPKWSWATKGALRTFARRGFAIVTGESLKARALADGCPAVVVHDEIRAVMPEHSDFDDQRLGQVAGNTFVLVPLAYANDEPLEAILEAAALRPSVQFVLTGRPPSSFSERAPSNVFFSGYASNSDYSRLVSHASAIAALTTRPETMQRAGYEALSAGKALLTSDMPILRDYFTAGTVFVAPDGPRLAAGVDAVVEGRARFESDMLELRSLKLAEQELAHQTLRSAFHRGAGVLR
jgi:hypothetical protein